MPGVKQYLVGAAADVVNSLIDYGMKTEAGKELTSAGLKEIPEYKNQQTLFRRTAIQGQQFATALVVASVFFAIIALGCFCGGGVAIIFGVLSLIVSAAAFYFGRNTSIINSNLLKMVDSLHEYYKSDVLAGGLTIDRIKFNKALMTGTFEFHWAAAKLDAMAAGARIEKGRFV